MKGQFVISLDFEKYWGVFDVRTLESNKSILTHVKPIIIRLLDLCDQYNIKITFATVGFLFAKSKDDLVKFFPSEKPNYSNQKLSPYDLFNTIGNTKEEITYYFADSLLKLIINNGNHEIGSHTFCHYYCNETGQTKKQFEADLKAAIRIAKRYDVNIKSIVFPRNQLNKEYIKVCAQNGITSYRGTENHWMYDTHDTKQLESPLHRIFRLLDAYINVSGHNTYKPSTLLDSENNIVNIRSSRFLRSHNKKLKFLEPLKLSRIKKGMQYAAKNNEMYHLWWHPHNFGTNMEENFIALEEIFKTYSNLNKDHGFESNTMSGLAEKLLA